MSLSVPLSLCLSVLASAYVTTLPKTKLCYDEKLYSTLAYFLSPSLFFSVSKAISHKHIHKKDDYTNKMNINKEHNIDQNAPHKNCLSWSCSLSLSLSLSKPQSILLNN